MNLLKRIAVSVISCTIVTASIASYSTVSAVDTESSGINMTLSSDIILETENNNTSEMQSSSETVIVTQPVVEYGSETVTTAVSDSSSESDSEGPVQITVAAVTSINPSTTVETTTTAAETENEQHFNVFGIYEAHVKYVSSSTTAEEVKGGETITVPSVIGPSDVSGGVKGIDVSKWQADIDWDKVKADGINFAIIRAGYGKHAYQEDPYFDINMVNAEKAGLDRGIYWYSYATTVEEAYQEAEACYEVIKNYSFEYPLLFDIEEKTQEQLSTATVSAIIDTFCSVMQEKGYYVGIYSYASFLKTKVYEEILTKYDIAVAHFNVSQPNYSLPYGIWQYSSTGTVNGITGDVDLDYAYKDYPYIMSSNHKNGY